ncbi:heavy metal-responsive transcriptional regulator [Synechococcus sp. PCC 7336]|uniref:heavy metal-responsive transcriptional regulator n=1 Tax=Synechococcus sp. PCC 7336 TaxID=195250 RepID=UPI000347949D|nr:heavy metal-responsive transcriptional regulator [Synechococcus sp. PCC 7336]
MRVRESQLLRIGELKTETGLPVKTLRYYEELGLIRAVKRTAGGFRLFSPAVVPRLAFIKRAQHLGFKLQEIHHILQIHDRGELPCREVKSGLETKIAALDRQIEQLQTLKAELRSLVDISEDSPARKQGIICPIIQLDS